MCCILSFLCLFPSEWVHLGAVDKAAGLWAKACLPPSLCGNPLTSAKLRGHQHKYERIKLIHSKFRVLGKAMAHELLDKSRIPHVIIQEKYLWVNKRFWYSNKTYFLLSSLQQAPFSLLHCSRILKINTYVLSCYYFYVIEIIGIQ